MTEQKAWKKSEINIELQHPDGWKISYNPDTTKLGMSMTGDIKDETAIVTNSSYYILNGDHRKAYESLFDKGLDACMEYFNDNQHLKSSWSN